MIRSTASSPRRHLLIWGSILGGLLTPALASVESDAVLGNFGPLEWIAGINAQVLDNSNEWRPSYEGQPATTVDLSEPHSATGDLLGNVFIADKNAHAIRLIDRAGIIRTIAGTGVAGFNGDGPALTRQLNGPQHVYPMPDGSYFILDTGNNRVRRVDPAGQMVTVFQDPENLSRGLWVKRDASVIYYCTNKSLKRWTPSQGLNPGTLMATGFSELGNIDVARHGDIFLTDRGADATDPTFSRVFRIPPTATPASYTPVAVAGTGGATDSGPGTSGAAALAVGLRGVRGIAFHPAGGYFLATHKGGDLWYVDSDGICTMIVQGNDASTNVPALLPRSLPALGGSVVSELRFVSVALNGDLLIAANDAGFILRARYLGPIPPVPSFAIAPLPSLASAAQVTWTGTPGSWFLLESSSGLAASPWKREWLGATTSSGGSPFTWTDPEPASEQPRRFYRLREFRDWPN